MMEIVTSLPTSMNGASGGTKKHVEEWSRLDRLTGMLEHARVEADHWASTTSNSRHHFGKVVDSRARNLADGSVQQKQQTKQLEVFQAHIPGGSVQVIRSHTSTTSSWHNSKALQSHTTGWSSNASNNLLNHHISEMEPQTDDLKFAHNAVNLNPEKTKANVARSLANRRPPTRSKISKMNLDDDNFFIDVSPTIYEIEDKTKNEINIPIDKVSSEIEIPLNGYLENDVNTLVGRKDHEKLEKKKSISNENLSMGLLLEGEKIDEKENSDPWRRSSRTRWSLQHPSRYKRKDETTTETNPSSKSELESVLEKVLRRKGDFEPYSKAPDVVEPQKPVSTWRRKSFVTEATLRETKQKLRHLSIDKTAVKNDKEEIDDGICTESKGNSDKEDEKIDSNPGFINSTIVENQLTNSLESRTINKSDDWFDRRKSYGFEPVQSQRNIISSLNSSPKTNLSTDSGICRSSELELVSTPIIKKVTEATEDRIRVTNEEENKYRESVVTKDVSELKQKFENFDKPRNGATVVTLMEEPKVKISDPFDSQREAIKKGRVLETIRRFEPTPLIKANSYFLEQIAEKPNPTSINSDLDILSKRHSIACDDSAYMPSTFITPEPSFAEKISLPGKPTVVNVNNFESDDTPLPVVDIDTKKPKKVEFSKTEVHFAAAEPGKIKIVETDEKPPPNNLYRRKKRSVSASPKIGLPQTKFGDYEKSLFCDKSADKDDDVSRSAECVKIDNKSSDYSSPYTSTTSDNGLAVTISSMKPTDYRRASWSVVENPSSSQTENKAGYSTKINFDGGGVTVVADVKTSQYEQHRKSFADLNETNDKVCNFDASRNSGENIQEKLIVRIGGSGAGCNMMENYVQRPTFSYSFRNSINTSKTSGFVKLSKKSDDNLKSTSLIIDTIKKSMDAKTPKKSNNDEAARKISPTKSKQPTFKIEQPSTYITEMNKLQQKYRIKENRSTVSGVIRNENTKNRIYNTIPVTKNGYARTKLLNNDLPSVLSAFDNLCRTIDKVIDENANEKIQNTRRSIEILKKFSTRTKSVEKLSSQSRFLCDLASQDDGNVSDDSLKADEEVRSYMSTAIMEEYENELCGSWSRKRYFKHIKPVKIVAQDEISDKSHFNPLKSEEDKFKTIANVIDVKKPKITSVAMKLNQDVWTDKNPLNSPKKSTTVLLNDPKTKNNFSDGITSNDLGDLSRTERSPYKIQNTSPVKICNYVGDLEGNKERKQSGSSIKINNEAIYKNQCEPVKVIYHDIKMVDKPRRNEEKRPPSPKKESDVKNLKKGNIKESFSTNGSIRRRTNSINDKDKLFDSGRDGWLNLPKERKSTSERKLVENGKHKEVGKKLHIDHVKKEKRIENSFNGCGDISSEEDLTRKNKKLYKPLSTIDEKSNVLKVPLRQEKSDKLVKPQKTPATRTTSNSSIESRSNAYDFKNPVLKTEERSKRRAARMLQRTSSREMLMNYVASSSEDVTSDNEIHYSRSNKPRNVRKLKSSPKSSKPTSNLPGSNRIITQHSTAKMQINIFNMKERPNESKKSNHSHYVSSKPSNAVDSNGLLKNKSHTGQREISANSSQRSRASKAVTVTSSNRENKKLSCSSMKSSRPVR